MRNVKRIGRKKPEMVTAFLKRFEMSLNPRESNPTPVCLSKYMNTEERRPVVVFCAGGADKVLTERLRVPNIVTYLNITDYSRGNVNHIQMRLENMITRHGV